MQRSPITIKLMVDNEFGVLTRITALLRREGFNIRTLAVEVTENPEMSRMLLSVECLHSAIPRVMARLNKLDSVKYAAQVNSTFDLDQELHIVFEHLRQQESEENPHG